MELIAKIINNILCGRFKHLSRFSIIGIANTLIDFMVFTVFNSLFDINYAVCQVLGYSCGVANSFIFNKRWTFQDKNSGKKNIQELLKFILINLVTLLITTLAIKLLVNNMNLNVYAGKIIVTVLAQITNFFAYKLWVFQAGRASH